MVTYTSSRERRLWFSVALLAVLILASSLSTPLLSEQVLSEVLLAWLFGLAFFGVLIALGLLARGVRFRRIELGVILGVLAVFLIVLVRLNMAAERSHLFEYSFLAALLFEAIRERNRRDYPMMRLAGTALLVAVACGCVDEGIQYFLPNRVFDVRDLGFNAGAAFGGVTLMAIVARAKTRAVGRG
jgi:hypothetical protein